MTNNEWRESVEIRYSEALYLGYGRSAFYHFIYGYKRICIEVLKSFVYILLSLATLGRKREDSCLSLYATKNQHKAIESVTAVGVDCGAIISLYQLSISANIVRLLIWLAKFVMFPICFLITKRREGTYFSSLASGMRLYARILGVKLDRSGVRKVCISNDHAGDIYLLTLALREIPDVAVVYIQHGAAKLEFPVNYFDHVYLYSEQYIDVYKELSLNPEVNIEVVSQVAGSEVDLEKIDFLVCFSHQFRVLNNIKLMRFFKSHRAASVGVRFHPSDRLAFVKYKFLTLFYPVKLSSSNLSFETDSLRADRLICASSSILLDVFSRGHANKIIWLKSIGLEWDYYNLEGNIVCCADEEQLSGVLSGE